MALTFRRDSSQTNKQPNQDSGQRVRRQTILAYIYIHPRLSGRHPTFRSICVNLAQSMYRTEVKLRTNLLGEPNQNVRPLSEARYVTHTPLSATSPSRYVVNRRAIENGANALAEGFLFGVAAVLIVGETWRSSRSQSRRRDDVDDKLEGLSTRIQELSSRLDQSLTNVEERLEYERQRYFTRFSLTFG